MQKCLKNGKYRYKQQNLLGEGSFGKVFRGLNTQNGREVALKQIQLSSLDKDEETMKKILLSQISVMRKFNKKMQEDPCPFLVRQEDVFRTDKHIYIVMEVCNGGTLQNELDESNSLAEKQCIKILFCIARGLQFMYEMGIAHRDLKPDNIFISSQKLGQSSEVKVYKIGDFGFAAKKQQLDIAMGTFPYMAPQMFKKGNYGLQVDVWSLGIIAYQIRFGGFYFIGGDKFELKDNILQKPFALPQHQKRKVSGNYYDFIQKCLNKQPKYRLCTDQLLSHPLFFTIQMELSNLQQQSSKIEETKKDSKLSFNKLFSGIRESSVPKNDGEAQKQQVNVYGEEDKVLQIDNHPSKDNTTSNEFNKDLMVFGKLRDVLQECRSLRALAENFQSFEENTKRITQFIQIYLLKDAYVMMNRLTYTLMNKQNCIELPPCDFQVLFLPQNKEKFERLYEQCMKQINWITGLFNEKYKRFRLYIQKFPQQDQFLICQVVNQEPYKQTNSKVLQKQLKKWIQVIEEKEYISNWFGIKNQCSRMLSMRLK